MSKITPFLWFDHQAEEAITFYSDVFKNASVLNISRYGDGAPLPAGTVMSATIELEGQQLMLLNGGPMYTFNEAISLFVSCHDQQEVDYYWDKLTAGGGEEGQCGWLKDKFGLSWQIIPDELGALLGSPDPAKAGRAMAAMLKMRKIDLAALREA